MRTVTNDGRLSWRRDGHSNRLADQRGSVRLRSPVRPGVGVSVGHGGPRARAGARGAQAAGGPRARGVYASIAESMASIATALAVAHDGEQAMGLSNNTSFMRPITQGTIHAQATRLHRGRTTWVWDVRFSDDQGRTCALTRMTIAVRPGARRASRPLRPVERAQRREHLARQRCFGEGAVGQRSGSGASGAPTSLIATIVRAAALAVWGWWRRRRRRRRRWRARSWHRTA